MIRSRKLWAFTLILLVAVYTGYFSVALPLIMNQAGFSMGAIAAVFTAIALVAGAGNLLIFPMLLRTMSTRGVLLLCSAVAGLGQTWMSMTASAGPLWFGIGACLTMSSSMIFPALLGSIGGSDEQTAAVVARARMIFVLGFAGGYLLVAARAYLQVPYTAVSIALLALLWAGTLAYPTEATAQPTKPAGGGAQARLNAAARAPLAITVAVVSAVLLMKGADSVRVSYFPIVVAESFGSEMLVAVMYLITLIVEIAMLAAIPRLDARFGNMLMLGGIALAGMVSFILMVLWSSVTGVAVASVVYAAFTAGFQAVGMVALSNVFRRGLAHGAAVYTALVQAGSVAGTVIPLVVGQLDPRIFWVGAACCALAFAVAASALVRNRKSVGRKRPTRATVESAMPEPRGSIPPSSQSAPVSGQRHPLL